jgi:(1->4)-alpha-D-glucan 1-alpha-D-glucosylmutase
MIPRATMRLQLHKDFTFADAARVVPYLAALGISHLYASPILTARPGSMHGYDVVDPTRVNPELGGEEGLRDLVAELRSAGLGLIVDIVPNHMYVGGNDNEWWNDVLRHGPGSRYAKFFDIDWKSENSEFGGKVLAPFLGKPYGEALLAAELTLGKTEDGKFVVRYFDRAFPIDPADFAEIEHETLGAYDPTGAAGPERLHRLLERQHYRLASWRIANDELNWRRFFDVTELAALRIEETEVFEGTHAALFRLYAEGLIDGVRVDHIDGLTDPGGYCRKLRSSLAALEEKRPAAAAPGRAYIVVEKILASGETLPAGWETDGTTGYDFMNQASAILHDPAGEAPLNALWSEMSGRAAAFDVEEESARRDILARTFGAQLEALVESLFAVSQQALATRDLSRGGLRRVLVELLAHFRIYRTYPREIEPSERNPFLKHALDAADRTCLRGDRPVLAFVGQRLSGEAIESDRREAQILAKFQQLSSPMAAKSVEDTAFYRYGRLLSRNDVGFDPRCFAMTPEQFHHAMAERQARYPRALLATATHDHKRGEDVRARLAVLSEIPDEWSRALRRWMEVNQSRRRMVDGATAPSPGDEAMLYQMIVGAWPPDLSGEDEVGCAEFATRLAGWQQKALREAKLATDWIASNENYERAAADFLRGLFADAGIRGELAAFARRIGPAGAVNGLAQSLLKLTVPGVPDFFQGTEFWDMSLVDPDNRRPVDFSARVKALQEERTPSELAPHWREGRVKQAMIERALKLRRAQPILFSNGDYFPFLAEGPGHDHVLAFGRQHEGAISLTVVARLVGRFRSADDGINPLPSIWKDTQLRLPEFARDRTFRNVFDGTTLDRPSQIPLETLLARFPAALLASE